MGVLGAGTAVADPVSLTLNYSCSFPLIGNQPIAVKLTVDVANSATVGVPTQGFAVNAVATVSSSVNQALGLIGAKTLEGTADGVLVVAAPQGALNQTVPLDLARTSLPGSGSFDVAVTGTTPTITFSQPGTARLGVGGLTLHLAPRDGGGGLTLVGRFDSSCKLAAGQNGALTTLDITAPVTPTGSPTQGAPTQGATEPTPPGATGSTGGGMNGATTPGTSRTTAAGATTPATAPAANSGPTAGTSAGTSTAGATAAAGSATPGTASSTTAASSTGLTTEGTAGPGSDSPSNPTRPSSPPTPTGNATKLDAASNTSTSTGGSGSGEWDAGLILLAVGALLVVGGTVLRHRSRLKARRPQ
ncbi:DUF6801 domain-containing protein [Kitasatospora kifunensis]|uniref:DUF6801 domain-containing protein n=1 Tax=Kitasatospora kifunensis TaxID=58351 RepID=A0A7W7VZA1_KITKI|nr:DUF6801 domain-containing protein [Kitasatospora kifunensis]MBB4927480.1 hypothetical protein [Kitasatospora kifunensis]